MANARLAPNQLTDFLMSRFAHNADKTTLITSKKHKAFGAEFCYPQRKVIVLQPASEFSTINPAGKNPGVTSIKSSIVWANELSAHEPNTPILIPFAKYYKGHEHWTLLMFQYGVWRFYDPKSFFASPVSAKDIESPFKEAGIEKRAIDSLFRNSEYVGIQHSRDEQYSGYFVAWIAKWVAESIYNKKNWPVENQMPSETELAKLYRENMEAFQKHVFYQQMKQNAFVQRMRNMRFNQAEIAEDVANAEDESLPVETPIPQPTVVKELKEEKAVLQNEAMPIPCFVSKSEADFTLKDSDRDVVVTRGAGKLGLVGMIFCAAIPGMFMGGGIALLPTLIVGFFLAIATLGAAFIPPAVPIVLMVLLGAFALVAGGICTAKFYEMWFENVSIETITAKRSTQTYKNVTPTHDPIKKLERVDSNDHTPPPALTREVRPAAEAAEVSVAEQGLFGSTQVKRTSMQSSPAQAQSPEIASDLSSPATENRPR